MTSLSIVYNDDCDNGTECTVVTCAGCGKAGVGDDGLDHFSGVDDAVGELVDGHDWWTPDERVFLCDGCAESPHPLVEHADGGWCVRCGCASGDALHQPDAPVVPVRKVTR
jgi:hypothetical protein